MGTFLVFVGVIVATVAVMYVMIKLLMMFDRGGKDEASQQDASSHPKVEASRK